LDANKSERVQAAIDRASDIFKENPSGDDPDELAKKLVTSIITDKIFTVTNIGYETESIERLLVLLEDAKLSGTEIIDPEIYNNTCWHGSIHGYAQKVLQYCEEAVKLAPDNPNFRDSRGLAKALTGDYPGAIDDFQSYVDSGQYDEAWVQQRRDWIVALRAGENPFTPEVLEQLKNQ
jgi:hypothetical protein